MAAAMVAREVEVVEVEVRVGVTAAMVTMAVTGKTAEVARHGAHPVGEAAATVDGRAAEVVVVARRGGSLSVGSHIAQLSTTSRPRSVAQPRWTTSRSSWTRRLAIRRVTPS